MVDTSQPHCLMRQKSMDVVTPARWICRTGRITDPHFNTRAGCQKEFLCAFQSEGKCFFLTSPYIERAYRRVGWGSV